MTRAAPPRTVAHWVYRIAERFERAGLTFGHGTDNPLDEAAWLVAHALAIPFAALESQRNRRVPTKAARYIEDIAARRIELRTPLAYLIHEAWFAGHKFYVDERVLVPRSIVGDFIPQRFQPWLQTPVRRALDLCTGSGCIAIALAHAFPAAQVDAVDISGDALAVAAQNVALHQLASRVQPLQSDLFAELTGRYDLIVSNPPYVDAKTMRGLAPEFRREPALALAAGADGLNLIIDILAQAPAHLSDAGLFIAEVGNSCRALQAAFPAVPFTWLHAPSGDESVFMLPAATLAQHLDGFAAARRRAKPRNEATAGPSRRRLRVADEPYGGA